jgi:hypothetical protein
MQPKLLDTIALLQDMLCGRPAGFIDTASSVKEQVTPAAVVELAHELGIYSAIMAGRVRKELHSYRLLTHYVGNGGVRKFLNRNEFVYA